MKQIKQWAWAVLLVIALPLMATDAQAQIKIGFANPDALVGSMAEYATAMQTLQREVQTSQQALQAMQDEFQEKAARFEQQRPLLTSEESINRRQQELATLYQEIQTAAANEDQKLANRQTELIQPLFDRVVTVIEEVAKAQGIDLVLQQAAIVHIDEEKIVNLNFEVASKLGIQFDENAEASASN